MKKDIIICDLQTSNFSIMQETTREEIISIIQQQRNFFATQQTKDVAFRIEQLKKLKKILTDNEKAIADALFADLHKSYEEAFLTEFSIVMNELNYHLKHIKKWSKPEKVKTPKHLLPSSSYIYHEPLGLSLIIAPWNYPYQLLINPLIGAISSGCCAVLKPSPDTPQFEKLISNIIENNFDKKYIAVAHGDKETNSVLLEQRFDFIFFTGSPRVGKIVMKAAAENLTAVVLELGGKSPCIVDKHANIPLAAKRIVFGKIINAGQTCIAPDYIFAHQSVKNELIEYMKKYITEMLGGDTKQSKHYARIVNEKALKRLQQLLLEGNIVIGGEVDEKEKYLAPTIIDNVQTDFKIMQEEIFGPVFPILDFTNIDSVIEYINTNEKPLALYYFGKNKNAQKVLSSTSSGGGCINDTLMHSASDHLPFGGVGNSGLGKYHGKDTFLAFSNRKAVVQSSTSIELPFKYAPYKSFKLTKKLV